MFRIETDEYRFIWVILSDPDFEDLVAGIHLISLTLIDKGFGEYLLCAIFRFGNGSRCTGSTISSRGGIIHLFLLPARRGIMHLNSVSGHGWKGSFRLKMMLNGGIPSGDYPCDPTV